MGILDMLEKEMHKKGGVVQYDTPEPPVNLDTVEADVVVPHDIPKTQTNKVSLKVKLDEGVECPSYAHDGDSGFDIRAKKTVKFSKFQTRLVPTGLYMEIPYGYEVQIRPRSGYTLKTPFRVANSPGTIDSNYRGEVGIIIQNVSNKQLVVKEGEKIAQGVLVPIMQADFDVVEELSNSNRGADGFGSTDKGE